MRKNMDKLAEAAQANDTDRVIAVLQGGGVRIDSWTRSSLITHLQRVTEHVTLVRIISPQTGVLSKKTYAYLSDQDLKGGTIVEVTVNDGLKTVRGIVQPRHLNPITTEIEAKAKTRVRRVIA